MWKKEKLINWTLIAIVASAKAASPQSPHPSLKNLSPNWHLSFSATILSPNQSKNSTESSEGWKGLPQTSWKCVYFHSKHLMRQDHWSINFNFIDLINVCCTESSPTSSAFCTLPNGFQRHSNQSVISTFPRSSFHSALQNFALPSKQPTARGAIQQSTTFR